MADPQLFYFLNYYLFEIIKEYFLALIIFILTTTALWFLKWTIVKKIKVVVDHVRIELGNLLIECIEEIGKEVYFFTALWVSIQFIKIPLFIKKLSFYLLLISVFYYLAKSLQKIFNFYLLKFQAKQKLSKSTAQFLNQICSWFLWSIIILIVLENLGVNITALIAGLGIGGVAIAIALQNILSEIFAYFAIHLDKPFEIGDFIKIDEDVGEIKKIGIRSTRIKSLSGEELVVSNKELTGKRIRNFKKMKERRIVFNFGVVYQTPPEKLRKIPQIVKNIFDNLKMARLDRVHFKSLGDFSLIFEVAYYVLTPDYRQYMDLQEKINLALMEEFEKEKIEFAYPTQTLFLNKQEKG